MRSETLHAILPLAIVAGLALSLFAALETIYPSIQGYCSFSVFVSCAKVDQSAHTTTLGVQDYLWGIAGFVVLLALDVQVYRKGRGRWLDALTLLSAAGLALSAYLAWVELGVIGGFCLVCFGAYLSNAITLGIALWLRRPSSGSGRSASSSPAPADH